MHDLIEALRGGYGIMLAAAALYQGACRSIRSYAVAWPRLCALVSPLPCRSSLSGCRGRGPSAPEYDRVKTINMALCHQDATCERAIGPERGHTTKHRGARLKPASTTRGGRVEPGPPPPAGAMTDVGPHGPVRHVHGDEAAEL